MSLPRFALGCWHERQRQSDIDILWPLCLKHAPDNATARQAFSLHAARASAWAVLPDDERRRQIEMLARHDAIPGEVEKQIRAL
ncbi:MULTISPECIES: hypothetical protein [Bacteria]|uniref:hypothetical protein n=1 Tax=Bacteria TaxID=2 RepID=UPI00222FCDEB|nr:hypothetical protein [Bosea sp. NBC_00550]UZF90880.1 hypothetical protein NWE53_17260 [Bosea sp. NBC_00550]